MPQRSRKHARVMTVRAVPDRGLDLSTAPTAIHNNALTRAYNVWYEPQVNGLVTRYGLSLADAPALPGPVSALHYHVGSNGNGHLLAATGTSTGEDALYRLAPAAEGTQWHKVLALRTTDGNAPGLLSFDGVLLVADGRDEGLVAWDGEKEAPVPGSPARPTVVKTIADRVVCNSLNSPDAVFFSEPENHAGWSVSNGGAAVIIPAGFGEGMEVNAMADLYGLLVVSKVHKDAGGNITQKRLHGISTLGAPADWCGVQLSQTSSSATGNAMAGVTDRVYFLDSDGPQSLIPAPGGAYGDVAIDSRMGPRIHPLISGTARRVTAASVQWLRNLAQLWFIVRSGAASKIAVYHPMQNGGAWSELQFPISPRSLCEVGERVYLAGDDGRLYQLEPTGNDWTPEGPQPVYATLRTKKYEQMGGDVILRGVKLGIGRIIPAGLRVEAVDDNDTRSLVAETTTAHTGSADQKIYDAHDKIANANWKIAGGIAPVPQYFDWRANVRKTGLYLQVRAIGGRVVFESINGLLAVVG